MGLGRVAYCFAATIAQLIYFLQFYQLNAKNRLVTPSLCNFLIKWSCLKNGRKP